MTSMNISTSTEIPSANILYQSILNEDLETIKRVLKEHQSWKVIDNEGETVLHLAFKCKNNILSRQDSIIHILECFLNEGLSVNVKNAVGRTVLFLAVENRLRRVVDYLVERGATLNTRDQNGNSIIHLLTEDRSKRYYENCFNNGGFTLRQCVNEENIGFLNWLLSKGVDGDIQNNNGETAFSIAIERKANMNVSNDLSYDSKYETEVVKFLLEKGVSIDHVSNILILEFLNSRDPNPDIIRMILQRYTNVNTQNRDGNTALHLLIRDKFNALGQYKNHAVEVVRTILSKGANVNLKNNIGETIVCLAIRIKHFEVLKALLEYGGDVSSSNNVEAFFLHDISSVPRIEDEIWAPIVDTLVQAGWNVNEVRPDNQFTPLLEACISSNLAIVQKLIDNGANVNYVEKQNLKGAMHMTAGHLAIKHTNATALFEILAKAGAKINAKNRRGETALHLAPFRGYNAMNKLLQLGAHVDVRDKSGFLPLHKAVIAHTVVAIKALLKFGADVNDEAVSKKMKKLQVGMVDCLTKHCLTLKAGKLPAIGGYANSAKKIVFQPFYVECLREVEALKAHRLDDETTLYHLLHMNINFKYVFIKDNGRMKELVESPLLQTIFPKYHILILASYNKAVARHSLIEPAEKAWHYLIGIELSNYVERILAYLDNEDLRIMAEKEEGGKPLKRPSQLKLNEPAKTRRLS